MSTFPGRGRERHPLSGVVLGAANAVHARIFVRRRRPAPCTRYSLCGGDRPDGTRLIFAITLNNWAVRMRYPPRRNAWTLPRRRLRTVRPRRGLVRRKLLRKQLKTPKSSCRLIFRRFHVKLNNPRGEGVGYSHLSPPACASLTRQGFTPALFLSPPAEKSP